MLYEVITLMVALLTVAVLRPAFNALAGKEIPFAALFSLPFILGLLAATVVTALRNNFV